jgi:hypothetical protein
MRGVEKLERVTVEIPWDLYLRIQAEKRRREDAGRPRADRAMRAIVIEWMEAGAALAEERGGK